MKLRDQILDLLEPEEKRQIEMKEKMELRDERFNEQSCWFYEVLLLPLFEEIRKVFKEAGRTVSISPSLIRGLRSPGWFPKLCISVRNERTLKYWIEVKCKGDQFIIVRYVSIETGAKNSSYNEIRSRKDNVVDNLYDIPKADIYIDFSEQYEHHLELPHLTSPLQ